MTLQSPPIAQTRQPDPNHHTTFFIEATRTRIHIDNCPSRQQEHVSIKEAFYRGTSHLVPSHRDMHGPPYRSSCGNVRSRYSKGFRGTCVNFCRKSPIAGPCQSFTSAAESCSAMGCQEASSQRYCIIAIGRAHCDIFQPAAIVRKS